MAEENFHLWRPSVISAKNPDQNNAYVGNVIIGVNTTKTEVVAQMNALGASLVQNIVAEGDSYNQTISDLVGKYAAVSNVLGILFEEFVEEYGEVDPDYVPEHFVLGVSQLDIGILE